MKDENFLLPEKSSKLPVYNGLTSSLRERRLGGVSTSSAGTFMTDECYVENAGP